MATGYLQLQSEAQVAINGLSFAGRAVKREQLMMILHKARSQIELEIRQTGRQTPSGLVPPNYFEDLLKSDTAPRTPNSGLRLIPERSIRVAQSDQAPDRQAKLEELAVRVALLEAAISLPKPVGTMGHNRGPSLEPEQDDEEEIRGLISLLKDDREKILSDPSLKDLAEREIQRAERGIELHSEFAKGAAKGAGFVVGKNVVEQVAGSAWWLSVYGRLLDVAHALRDLIF
ncbi:hypothetical protein [Bradyrhizobium sp. Bra64]|uniref:hypothetical protein n=1 Tax=Bradyrhizobium sp. Bra64 TaxID=2926009 RepID=UPI0021177308|nr:hypothetical protein [Bradyrhizobium sp. Bra64]